MDFKRLAEVELLDSAPEGATAFAEVNGEVKRVAGGIGGGSTGYVWDVTDKFIAAVEGSEEVSMVDGYMVWELTEEEAKNIIQGAMTAGGLSIRINLSSAFGSEGATGLYTASGPQFIAIDTVEGSMVIMGAILMGEELILAQISTSPSSDDSAGHSGARVFFPSLLS